MSLLRSCLLHLSALERTFLNWMSMAVTVSTLSTTLLGFSVSSVSHTFPAATAPAA